MEAPVVTLNFEIYSYESDINRRIKASSLQNLLQEAAYKGSEFCHCGYSTLKERGLFWALNRINFTILDTPVWGDRVTLQTWSHSQAGPLWHRNFRMFRSDAPDSPIVLGTSAWTLVDYAQRSIFRGDTGFDPAFHYPADTLPLCTQIIVPRELQQTGAGSHTVVWSDLDTNAHANNCSYTQWALDAMPYEYVCNKTLRDVSVNYYHEIHCGEKVDFLLARDGDVWFVTGKVGDRICFVERLEFA